MFGSGAFGTEPNIEMNTGLFIFVDDYIILRPHMSKSNLQYLAFDDRKLILFGIPILTLAIPFLFWGLELDFYLSIAHVEFFEDIVYTAAYWFFQSIFDHLAAEEVWALCADLQKVCHSVAHHSNLLPNHRMDSHNCNT
jgi:hypothetical protein